MERIYKRVENLDDKIKDMNLLYTEWKLLFLITDNTSISELKKFIEKDDEVINTSLESLLSKELIELAGQEKEEVKEEKGEEEEVEKEEEVKKEVKKEEAAEETIDMKMETGEEEVSQPEIMLEEDEENKEAVSAETDLDVLPMDEVEEKVEEVAEEEKDDLSSLGLDETSDIEITEEPEMDMAEVEQDKLKEEADMSELIEEIGELEKEVAEDMETEKLDIDISEEPMQKEVIEQKEEDKKEEAAADKKISSAGMKTVMVIDDSIVIRKMVEIALEGDEYKIVTAISGKEGMQLLDQENPNLVIVDMMLPDMNGIDVLKTVKASKGIPVIMLSGKDSPQLIETAKSVGADDFLPKPFRDEELVEKVKTLLK